MWQVKRIVYRYVATWLENGWEPFAATQDSGTGVEYIWLRRKVKKA